MARHDVLRGSHAWETIQNGIPPEISPQELRVYLHAWANLLTTLINAVNELYDGQDDAKGEIGLALERAHEAVDAAKREADREHVRIHDRIDRRGEDINKLGAATTEKFEKLNERIFDSEKGVMPTLAKKAEVSRLTVLLWTALVSITTAAIMLALNLIAKGG